jgi:hypothetical protein
VVAVKALPEDFEPMQAGSMMYFQTKDRWYLTYLDPGGEELYVVVDPPAGAVPAVPAEGAAPSQAASAPPAAKPRAVALTAQPNTPLTVRVAAEVSSAIRDSPLTSGSRYPSRTTRPSRTWRPT